MEILTPRSNETYAIPTYGVHKFLSFALLIIMAGAFSPSTVSAITVSGPITASSVSVTGDVTFSSVTVSSVTIETLLNVTGSVTGVSGRILQALVSSTTVTTTVSTTTFTAVSNLSKTIALSNAANCVRITLTGSLYTATGGPPATVSRAYVTIFRDSVNLGDANYGFNTSLSISANNHTNVPVSVRIIDFPGDTTSHTYQAYIRKVGNLAVFPDHGTGYLLLEELSQ